MESRDGFGHAFDDAGKPETERQIVLFNGLEKNGFQRAAKRY
jgi:hypothetical protein